MHTKFVFVTGGVCSSVGKGITVASLGRLLKARGLRVAMQKLDPYLNCNPGMLSPYQHGEVFVTDDGAEADLDLGHYERFIDETLTKKSTVTSGRIYASIINRERDGLFHGGTVQVIPHVTQTIKDAILALGNDQTDVSIVEIGGTTGDIECLPYLEAIRQLRYELSSENCLFVHVTLLPYLGSSGELKTKPTQHSVKELRSFGIQPDVIVCRSELFIEQSLKDKIALFCNVQSRNVISNLDVASRYEAVLMLEREGLGEAVCRQLKLGERPVDLAEWTSMIEKLKNPERTVTIALVGKYIELRDAYLSCAEALEHAGIHLRADVKIKWVQSEHLTRENAAEVLGDAAGIIAPGGYGDRGGEGIIAAAGYARENDVPFLGIGYGMQLAVVEFARSVAGLENANSTEVDFNTPHPVVFMPQERAAQKPGDSAANMRLGACPSRLSADSRLKAIYGQGDIFERHCNKYEINGWYEDQLTKAGLTFSGVDPQSDFIDAIELADKAFFIGVIYHPEFKSRPNRPHPLIKSFVEAAISK